MVTTNFIIVAHHDGQSLCVLSNQVQERNHPALDKVMGATPINEDNHNMLIDGAHNAQGHISRLTQ